MSKRVFATISFIEEDWPELVRLLNEASSQRLKSALLRRLIADGLDVHRKQAGEEVVERLEQLQRTVNEILSKMKSPIVQSEPDSRDDIPDDVLVNLLSFGK